MFSVAGIVDRPHRGSNVTKVRFSNDICRRVKTLMRQGSTRCDLIELPKKMTKVEALKYMMTLPEFSSRADQATLVETLESKTPRELRQRKPKATRANRKNTTTAQDLLDAVAG